MILIVVLAACSADDQNQNGDSRRAPIVRDSAGIEIVESPAPLWTKETRWRLEAEPSLVIRTQEEGEPEYVLHFVGNIARLPDGRLVVANGGSEELLVFDSAGTFEVAWGGRGSGPGEFSALGGMHTCGSHTFGFESLRGALFDAEGGVVSTHAMPRLPDLTVLGLSDDCGWLMVSAQMGEWIRDDHEDEGPIPLIQEVGAGAILGHALRVSMGDGSVDTLARLPHQEMIKTAPTLARWFTYVHVASYATDGQNVYYGWGDEPEVIVLGPGGEHRRIRWGVMADPVTADDWALYSQERARRIEAEPRLVARYPTPDDHPPREVEPFFSAQYTWPSMHSALLLDDEGHLWVRRYTRPSLLAESFEVPAGQWWVFDPAGRWLGEVETPENFLVRSVIGGRMYGVWRNEFDVEEIHRYTILK